MCLFFTVGITRVILRYSMSYIVIVTALGAHSSYSCNQSFYLLLFLQEG